LKIILLSILGKSAIKTKKTIGINPRNVAELQMPIKGSNKLIGAPMLFAHLTRSDVIMVYTMIKTQGSKIILELNSQHKYSLRIILNVFMVKLLSLIG